MRRSGTPERSSAPPPLASQPQVDGRRTPERRQRISHLGSARTPERAPGRASAPAAVPQVPSSRPPAPPASTRPPALPEHNVVAERSASVPKLAVARGSRVALGAAHGAAGNDGSSEVLLQVQPVGRWAAKLLREEEPGCCGSTRGRQRPGTPPLVELRVQRQDTIKHIKDLLHEQGEESRGSQWGGHEAFPDALVLCATDGTIGAAGVKGPVKQDSRTTVGAILAKRRREGLDRRGVASRAGTPTLQMQMDMEAQACCGLCSTGSCREWVAFVLCSALAMLFAALWLACGVLVSVMDEAELPSFAHVGFVGSFFGVLGAGSMVFFVWFLLPRYSGKRGVSGSQKRVDAMNRDTCVWPSAELA
jgi:hypothetical protein